MVLFLFGTLFIFILIPATGLLFFSWWLTSKKIFIKILAIFWFSIFGLISLGLFIGWFTSKTILTKSDYYGEYIVNRNYFPGSHADWQYNNFRFEIKDNDSIYFYVTEKEKILKTYRGIIKTTEPWGSARLIIDMEQPTHHIISSNPTTFRSAWSFYLVFYSPKYNNVFFKKGHWKSLDK